MTHYINCGEKKEIITNHLKMGGGKSPTGETIEINSLYFIKNGRPWIPIMGEIHFSRLPVEDWEAALIKMKAGGIQIISFYIFWLHVEEIEGQLNFDGANNVREFILLCQKHGLYVFLRIGPWVHGEARNGGFPDWLQNKPFPRRDNNEGYLTKVRGWYEALYGQVKNLFHKDGGPVIGVQLENELYKNGAHLLTLKRMAVEIGFDVPIYSVTAFGSIKAPNLEVIPFFGGYPEAPWTQHTRELDPGRHFFGHRRNDDTIGSDLLETNGTGNEVHDYSLYPYATCEIGSGVQSTYHRRPIISGDDIGALALAKLGSGNNLPGYYMYHGGKNPIGKLSTFNESKENGYPNDVPILNYDFQAPIGTYGQIREQYKLLKLQHYFLSSFGDRLAPMQSYLPEGELDIYDTTSLRFAVRADGESGFVFVNNYQRRRKTQSHENVQFCIETNGKKITFPDNGMVVPSGAYFILPFNFDMDGNLLKYATAQLLAKVGDTYFFFAIDGIDAEFSFESATFTNERYFEIGRVKVVTLSYEDAKNFYTTGGAAYISKANMYTDADGIHLYGFTPDLSYKAFDGRSFAEVEKIAPEKKYGLEYNIRDGVTVSSPYLSELSLGGEDKFLEADIKVSADEPVYLKISYVGSVAQLYLDGVLYDDHFYTGEPWLVRIKNPSAEIKLIVSELKPENKYLETAENKGLRIDKVEALCMYYLTCF